MFWRFFYEPVQTFFPLIFFRSNIKLLSKISTKLNEKFETSAFEFAVAIF